MHYKQMFNKWGIVTNCCSPCVLLHAMDAWYHYVYVYSLLAIVIFITSYLYSCIYCLRAIYLLYWPLAEIAFKHAAYQLLLHLCMLLTFHCYNILFSCCYYTFTCSAYLLFAVLHLCIRISPMYIAYLLLPHSCIFPYMHIAYLLLLHVYCLSVYVLLTCRMLSGYIYACIAYMYIAYMMWPHIGTLFVLATVTLSVRTLLVYLLLILIVYIFCSAHCRFDCCSSNGNVDMWLFHRPMSAPQMGVLTCSSFMDQCQFLKWDC